MVQKQVQGVVQFVKYDANGGASIDLSRMNAPAIDAAFALLSESIRKATDGFRHSTVLLRMHGHGDKDVNIDLRTFFLLAVASGLNLNLEGKTGPGKTSFGRAALMGIFGQVPYMPLDITIGPDKLIDKNLGKLISGEGKLSQVSEATTFLTAPAVFLDELNRADPRQTSMLHSYLTNGEIVAEGGATFPTGIPVTFDSGATLRYQFKLTAMNLGNDYKGTFQTDRAAMDRIALSVNIDSFAPSTSDKTDMLFSGKFNVNPTIHTDLPRTLEPVLSLFGAINSPMIEIDPQAGELLLALSNLSNCIHSPSGTRDDVKIFDPTDKMWCNGCHASAPNSKICGKVNGISMRTMGDLRTFSKALALYRWHANRKMGADDYKPIVEVNDVISAAKFVLNEEKLVMDEALLISRLVGHGHSGNATEFIVRTIANAVVGTSQSTWTTLIKIRRGEEPAVDETQQLKDVISASPFMGSQEDCRKLAQDMEATTKEE